jgi:hypothetical protein
VRAGGDEAVVRALGEQEQLDAPAEQRVVAEAREVREVLDEEVPAVQPALPPRRVDVRVLHACELRPLPEEPDGVQRRVRALEPPDRLDRVVRPRQPDVVQLELRHVAGDDHLQVAKAARVERVERLPPLGRGVPLDHVDVEPVVDVARAVGSESLRVGEIDRRSRRGRNVEERAAEDLGVEVV